MTFQPEFCQSNYADLNVNTNFTLTLLPAVNWYEVDKKLIYDHRSDRLLYTTGADDDTTSVYITFDMGGINYITAIKLLKINAKSGSIEVSDDNATWSTLYSFTTNTLSSIHWYTDALTGVEYVQLDDGSLVLTAAGERIEVESANHGRYIRVTLTATQTPDQEKYIGELYIGQREAKIIKGKVINYSEQVTDPKASTYEDYNGTMVKNRRQAQYNSSMTIMRPDADESAFLKSIEINGGIYDFFPCPDTGSDIDNTLSIDDIHYVVASGSYGRNQYGNKTKGIAEISLVESKVVN